MFVLNHTGSLSYIMSTLVLLTLFTSLLLGINSLRPMIFYYKAYKPFSRWVMQRKWEKLTFSFYSLVGSVLVQ
jgi:hypothetical protein